MLDVVAVILQLALGIALPTLLLRFDEHRLSQERLARAWPRASFWSAVVAFGPLCSARSLREDATFRAGIPARPPGLGRRPGRADLVSLALSALSGE